MEAASTLNRHTVLYLYGMVVPPIDVSQLVAVEEGADIFVIELGDVACIASEVPARDYCRPEGARSPAEQLEWVTLRAWRHHEVLRRLHLRAPVIPLKFGTLCAGVDHVQALLSDLRLPILDLVTRLRGKDEWTLTIGIDKDALSEALQASDPALIALKDEERGLPEGRAYFTRKRLQKQTARLVDETVVSLEHTVCERLTTLGLEIAPSDRGGGSIPVLVERQRFDSVQDALAELEIAHADVRVLFEFVGPWPPYSFATALHVAGATLN